MNATHWMVAAVGVLVMTRMAGIAMASVGEPQDRDLFGATNLWTLRLELTGSAWKALFPAGEDPREAERATAADPGPGAGAGPVGAGNDGPRRPSPVDGPPFPRGPGGRGAGPGPVDRDFPWSLATFEGGGVTLTNVAIRFKGNSSYAVSRSGWKRPYKLDFNRGARGRTWLGAEELYLNNNINDATQFREALAYEIYRAAGVPAPRTAFGRVYLTVLGVRTNHYAGLYTLVEAVEGGFLRDHFGTKKGLLLKPERLRGLEYLGPEWSAYVNRYEPKSDARAEDTSRFIELTRLVAEADEATFRRELPARLDVPRFLAYVAVTAWLANRDSFVGNGHNYYLVQPAPNGRAVMVPWDLNEAFGGHPPAGSRLEQARSSVLRPAGGPNRLLDRLLADPEWAAAYRRAVADVHERLCAATHLLQRVATLAEVVRDAVDGESNLARLRFEWVALGRKDPADSIGGHPSPDLDTVRRRQPGFHEDGPLAEWIQARSHHVADELRGVSSPLTPRRPDAIPGPRPPRAP